MKARTVENSNSRHGFISRVISKMAEFLERAACFRARDLYGKNNHIRMKAAVIFLSLALMLAGASFLPGNSHQAYSSSAAHKASVSIVADEVGLPNLQGEDAVEHLKKQGLYSSLGEAMTAARYKVYEDDRGKVDFYANNPAQRMTMKFDDGAMRLTVKQPLASSNYKQDKDAKARASRDSKPSYRTTEATLRLIGAGYGNRILTTTVEPEMRAEANRFTYHHQLRGQWSVVSGQWSVVADNQCPDKSDNGQRTEAYSLPDRGQITEWYINSASGIEHGFTLNSPPTERDGTNPLRVEMEFGGGFTIREKASGKGLVLSGGRGMAINYDKLKVIDAKGRELESVMKARGRRVSIEVADLEAEYPVTIDPVIDTEVTKIQASDRQADDLFGWSVSISGDTAIVGTPFEDTGGNNAGAAYIFERNTGGADNWGEVRKIQASDRQADDLFGWSVSISGDTAIVGADAEDTGSINAGAAYIFERNQGGANNWGEIRKIQASDREANDLFGFAVSISGDTAIVGALFESTGGSNAGAAYIFERNQGGPDNWGEVRKIQASDIEADDLFGHSVSISGDIAIVGANGEDTGGSSAGAAYIFERNFNPMNPGIPLANNWGEVTKIQSSDREAEDFFGFSVSISGDTAIVGALEEETGGTDAGAAYIFARNQGGANGWNQITKIQPSDPDNLGAFGTSVRISGDTIVVGAPGTNSARGVAYVFARNQGGADLWGQVQILAASSSSGDLFGTSVGISGDTIVVGAPGENSAKGAAYVFARNQGGADFWGVVQRLTASSRSSGDVFGTSVAIDIATVVVGSPGADIAKGSAYVFGRNEGGADAWDEVERLRASDRVFGDLFGTSVGISSDTVVVGASGADTAKGAAYVFARNEGGADHWDEVEKLKADDRASGDVFGFSVSIDVDTIVVGANGNDSAKGAAYVFSRNQGGAEHWDQVTKLTAASRSSGDLFGFSVAINGDFIVVGAHFEDTGGEDAGAAYLFTINCPPMISTMPVSIEQGTTINGATIATVSDDLTPASNLIVTVDSSPASITVSNIINTNGTITADLSADCSAPLGANTVTLSAMDEHGLVSMADLTVTVTAETTPPVVTCPADIMTGTDKGQCSAVVNFTPTANDNCDGAITPSCNPPSGSSFPVGTTTVTCTAIDSAGNTGSCMFTVSVSDTEAPSITCPLPPTRNNDPGMCSAVVTFTASAKDNCNGTISLACVPPSGSSFPVGITTVTCMATDTAGNSSSCMFNVMVNDTQAPFIVCPGNITAIAPNPGSATVVVNYATPSVAAGTAGDNCGVASIVCNPPSGSAFPLGTTTVTCTVTDTSALSSQCSFTVSTFDVCIEDDSNPNSGILFISTGPNKGDYRICCGGQTLTGRGTISNKNGVLSLTHFHPSRRVQAYLFMNQQRGTASLQSPPTAFPCTINDSNTANNSCSCSANP